MTDHTLRFIVRGETYNEIDERSDAVLLGFMGDRTVQDITFDIQRNETVMRTSASGESIFSDGFTADVTVRFL